MYSIAGDNSPRKPHRIFMEYYAGDKTRFQRMLKDYEMNEDRENRDFEDQKYEALLRKTALLEIKLTKVMEELKTIGQINKFLDFHSALS